MGNQNKLLFLFLSVMLLCTLICGLFFFEKGNETASSLLTPCAAILSEDGKSIVFTDRNGSPITQISTDGMFFSDREREALMYGITALSEEELMSIAEDYIS